MMREQLIEKIMEEVIKKVDTPKADEAPKKEEKKYSSLTEFVGTGIGDSIGLVIADRKSVV